MWVEFVVGSRPCSEGFLLGSPVFLPPQKPTFLNSKKFDLESADEEPHRGYSSANSRSLFIFIQEIQKSKAHFKCYAIVMSNLIGSKDIA